MKASRLAHNGAAASIVLLAELVAFNPAFADDLTVTGAQTTASSTAAASNGSAGNMTVASGGSIIITAAAPAVTLNSNNIVTNSGTISSSAVSGATGVLISGTGLSGISLINNATISTTGAAGSGNYGLLVTGDPISGSITAGLSSAISVLGDSSTGVSIAAPFTGDVSLRTVTTTGTGTNLVSVTAPLTGNLTLLGVSSAAGGGGYGLLVAAPVSGTVRNAGSLDVGTTRVVDATTGAVTAGLIGLAGERISASVGGGLLNDRYYIDANGAEVATASIDTTVDTLVTGSVLATGTAPALWVAPDAANPQAITIGAAGTGADAYAIVNRGILETVAGNTGLATVALRVGGGGATTTLAGGIDNQATGAVVAYSLDGSATGVDLLAGAVVPAFVNQGALTVGAAQTAATTSVAIGAGGAAYGVVAEAGSVLGSVVNSGTMAVTASGTGNGATVILDRSGTLASINNSGTITATAATGALTRAIDLSASAAAVTVTNSGTITGDIVFGSGNSTLALTAGKITGAIAFGSGSNLLAMSGTSTLANVLTSGSALNVTLADSASLNLTGNAVSIGSLAASGSSTLIVPVSAGTTGLLVNGAASFTGNSNITLSVQSLAQTQNLSVVTATGGITTDHLSTLINALNSSYLFTAGAATLTGNTLAVSLVRKTADEIGLTGSQAALFNGSITALSNGSAEAVAISNLGSQAAVVAAYRQITPPSYGRAQLRAAQTFADTGFGAAADRLSIVEDLRHGGVQGIGVWVQEVGDFSQQAAGTNENAFKNSGFGLAGGIDVPLLGLDAVGVALVSNWTTIHQSQTGLADVNVPIATVGIEPYASWSWKPLFVQVTGLAAHMSYESHRALSIGSVADTVTANWTGTQFGAGATLGARFKLGRFRITPTNSVYWTTLRQGKYTETGGGNFDLAVASQTDSVTSDTSKLSLAYLLPFADGTLRFEGHGAYVHEFDAKPTSTVVSFVSGGDAITLAGDEVRGTEHSFGGGIGYTQELLSFRAGYDRRQGEGFHDQAFVATIGMAF